MASANFYDLIQLGSTVGRYNKIVAAVFPDRYAFTSLINYNTIALVMEYTDLAGNVVKSGTTLFIISMVYPGTFRGSYVFDHIAPKRDDIYFYNVDSEAISNNYFEYFGRETGHLLFETRIIYPWVGS